MSSITGPEVSGVYYSKVQYRYKGGNYLLWLKKISYAEDPGYIHAVIRVLEMLNVLKALTLKKNIATLD